MASLRRSVAALSGVLLLQLTLLGSGTVCTMHWGGQRAHGRHHMAGMAMATSQAVASVTVASMPASPTRGSHHGCDATSNGDDCRSPWGSGQCISQTTCSAPAAPAAPAIVAAAQTLAVHGASVPSEQASFHSGPGVAPELPPPRA